MKWLETCSLVTSAQVLSAAKSSLGEDYFSDDTSVSSDFVPASTSADSTGQAFCNYDASPTTLDLDSTDHLFTAGYIVNASADARSLPPANLDFDAQQLPSSQLPHGASFGYIDDVEVAFVFGDAVVFVGCIDVQTSIDRDAARRLMEAIRPEFTAALNR